MTAPRNVGRYQVTERVAAGSFATVWRARDHELDTDVAIKILADNWADNADVRSRFVEEARMLRRAYSDRIVRVYDIGTTDGDRPYFVMSFADRGTLHDRLVDGRLPADVALQYARQAGEGIAALHELGILHRDLKPSNIVFLSTGGGERLLIADLGLAKSIVHGTALTITGGTPGYMAPEQATQGARVDPRTDVYGLGAVAYHMLTGQPTTSTLVGSPAVSVGELCPDLAGPVDAVVMRALARDPADRWPDVGTFIRALNELPEPPPTPTVLDQGDTPPPTTAAPEAAGGGAAPRAGGTTGPAPGHHQPPPGQPQPGHRPGPPRPKKRILGMKAPVFFTVLGCLLLVLVVLLPVGVWAGPKVLIRLPSTVESENGAVRIAVRPLWTTDDLRIKPVEHTMDLAGYGTDSGRGIQLSTQDPPDTTTVERYDGVRGFTVVAGRALGGVPAEELIDSYPSQVFEGPDDRYNCATADHEVTADGFTAGLVRVYECGGLHMHAVVTRDDAAAHVFVSNPPDATEEQLDDMVRSIEIDASKLP